MLSAVVGPGLVVCVRTRDGVLGGMTHVAAEPLGVKAAGDLSSARVAALLADIEEAGGCFEGATADIVGGADVLHLYPQHLRQQVISVRVERLTALLESKTIRIARMRVGGSEARRVDMVLPGSRLDVRSVSRARPRRIPGDRETVEVPPAATSRPVAVDMGCMAVASSPSHLTALLGSCVGIALYDPGTKVGGLAHVMLPSADRGSGENSKFADTAVPALLESLSRMGGSRKRVVAKIAGGANVLKVGERVGRLHIGRANIESATRALGEHGVEIVWQDTGGTVARRMLVDLDSFDVTIKWVMGTPGS